MKSTTSGSQVFSFVIVCPPFCPLQKYLQRPVSEAHRQDQGSEYYETKDNKTTKHNVQLPQWLHPASSRHQNLFGL